MTSRRAGTKGPLAAGIYRMALAVGVFGAALAAAGCGNRSSDGANTGIRVNVYLSEQDAYLDGELKLLEFHVATLVTVPNQEPLYVFDHEATGTTADVTGRLLVTNPYRLFLEEDGDGVMETVKVFVLAFKDQEFMAWGTLEDPDAQPFFKNYVVDRTIILYARERVPPPFDWLDTGCFYDRTTGRLIPSPNDMDCDGVPVDEDCDDTDPHVLPGGTEICYNEIDDDCDGQTDEVQDEDDDGYTNCDNDCDDHDNTVYPNAPERCDGKDNNCDGLCDEQFDQDNDNYTHCEGGTGSFILESGECAGPPTVEDFDCGPNDPYMNPGAIEECDGKDNDCDGLCDEGFDQDDDGYTTCGSRRGPDVTECMPPSSADEDCDDNDITVHPGQPELCDGKDTNCYTGDELTGYSEMCYAWYDDGGHLVCKRGARICDDTNLMGWGDCEVDPTPNSAEEPGVLCDLYEDCLISDPIDPYQCVVDQTTVSQVMCHVFAPSEWQLCAQPPTYPLPLPLPPVTDCEWWIVDTSGAADWAVALWVWDNNLMDYVNSGSYADGCDVLLAADPSNAGAWPPQAGTVQLVSVGMPGPVIDVYNVGISTTQASCTTGDSMDCNFATP